MALIQIGHTQVGNHKNMVNYYMHIDYLNPKYKELPQLEPY